MDATPIIIKKKKAHGHAHHGGSWKVAYADFVTAMMAFFMVMWIMGLSDDTRAQIQGYFNDPIGFVKAQPRAKTVISPKGLMTSKPGHEGQQSEPFKNDRQAVKELGEKIKKIMQSDPNLSKFLEHVKIEITDEGLRIEFLEDKNDFFETGSADLKPGALLVIKALGKQLALSGRPMGIEGHTDTVPFAGKATGNFTLSSERASSLADALSSAGVAEAKFRYVKGLADRQLRDAKNPTSAVNRRVTILLPYVAPVTSTIPLPKDAVRSEITNAVSPKINIGPRPASVLGRRK
jgi:chemotaxis protein MotB